MIENGGISLSEFQTRIKKCLSEMDKKQVDVMIVYGDSAHPQNLIYLTNYRPIGTDIPGNSGYNAAFLLEKDGTSTLIIDREWYFDWAKEETWVKDILADDQGDTLGLTYEFLKKKKLLQGKIEADTSLMPVEVYKKFMKIFSSSQIDEASKIVARARETKSEKEITLLSKALDILGKAHDAGLAATKEGVSEIDIALEIRSAIMKQGADFARALFVDSGPRSTIALASPMATDRKLKRGDMVLVSTFCTYKKYTAGLDRNWVVGEPSAKQRKLAEIELKTLNKAIELVKPGVKGSDFMKPVYPDFAEPLLKEAGFLNYNIQGYIGHGSGVHTKETPFLWKWDSTPLKPGMVIHIEPGIYSKDPEIGGMRTADTILVTDTGHENLTKYPRRIGTLA